MRPRVVAVAYGSAGDLFPLVPVLRRLADRGVEVSCAVPRPLAFHLRPWGIPAIHLGRGAELDALADPRIVTPRFAGWASIRRLADHYAARTLAGDVAAMEALLAEHAPAVVVTTTLAASARIAAHRRGVPILDLSIYPQVLARLDAARGFATDFRSTCLYLAGLAGTGVDSDLAGELAWGIRPDTVLLHDPVLLAVSGLDRMATGVASGVLRGAVGYPYWDDTIRSHEEAAEVDRWLDRSDAPTVLATMGSYMGVTCQPTWSEAAAALAGLGVRGLFLGPRRQLHAALDQLPGDRLVAGYVPLSTLAGRVSAVVHHGGLGTTFAALHAGAPAVVVPTAFDQPFNARLVELAGAGVAAPEGDLAPAVATAVGDDRLAAGARAMAARLVPGAVAADRAVARVLDRIG